MFSLWPLACPVKLTNISNAFVNIVFLHVSSDAQCKRSRGVSSPQRRSSAFCKLFVHILRQCTFLLVRTRRVHFPPRVLLSAASSFFPRRVPISGRDIKEMKLLASLASSQTLASSLLLICASCFSRRPARHATLAAGRNRWCCRAASSGERGIRIYSSPLARVRSTSDLLFVRPGLWRSVEYGSGRRVAPTEAGPMRATSAPSGDSGHDWHAAPADHANELPRQRTGAGCTGGASVHGVPPSLLP